MALKEVGLDRNGASVRYSPVLGGMYLDNEGNKKLIEEAARHAGATQTSTFEGLNPDTVSGKMRAYLKEAGFKFVVPSGKFVGIRPDSYDISGGQAHYVTIKLKDGSENIGIRLSMGHSGTQSLLNRLDAVNPGDHIEVSMYAKYEKSDKDDKFYTNHRVYMTKDGAEFKMSDADIERVKGISQSFRGFAEKFKADNPRAPEKMVSMAVAAAREDFYLEEVAKLAAKFTAKPADTETPEPESYYDAPADAFGDHADIPPQGDDEELAQMRANRARG